MLYKNSFKIALFSFVFASFDGFSQVLETSKEKPWSIHIEAGANLSKGNTNEESIYSKNDFEYKEGKWTEIFHSRLENTKANRQRIRERYDLNNQLRYNFTKKNFRLLELEYISDHPHFVL